MKNLLTKFPALLLALIVGILASPAAFAGSNIVIENGDPAGVGFNDPTPATPVGGNSGTTLGQQRLIDFQTAASIWGATLNSGPTITVHATWEALTCTSTSAVLGSAGAATLRRDFVSAPFGGTWYSVALANAITGTDSNPASAEITARFNINLGNTGCFDGHHWYLGLDGNHGSDEDLVTVLIHEFAHGLGFQTFTDASTGQQAGSTQNGFFPSIFDQFLLDKSKGKTWVQMTNIERAASAINTGNLVWVGPQVTSDAHSALGNSPRLKVNSPASVAGSYQVGTADFGPPVSSSVVTANVAQALSSGGATDGCSAITNPGTVSSKIALIDRGNCTFVSKTKNALNAGAVGVVIVDNMTGTTPPGMTGVDSTISIPTVSITQANGATIKTQLSSGVNATLGLDPAVIAGADSSGHPLLFTPNPFEEGSSVSHWDTSAFPNQLMEPNSNADLSHTVTLPKDLTASLMKDIGWSTTGVTPTVQFAQASNSVVEAAGNLAVTVNRTDTTTAASVDYATSDPSGLTACNQVTSNASSRCDYATTVGTLRFAAGESSKTIFIPVVDDGYVEGAETFTLRLSNPVGTGLGTNSTATITITDNDSATSNPIVGVPFFVRQQYIDFLGREPDAGGFAAWQNILNNCTPGDTSCDRIAVSSGFFRSPEFQDRGSFIFRFYSAALGRNPSYTEFMPDLAKVSGFLSDAQLEANKVAFVNEFMGRTEFTSKYGALGNAAFVDTLIQTAGLSSHPLRNAWVGLLNSNGATRAQVLRAFTESLEVYNKFYNQAFVVMQYFGYLRRDPDASYLTWVQILNTNGGDFRGMISGFMNANEYVLRFGP
jgi:hypothetical protein